MARDEQLWFDVGIKRYTTMRKSIDTYIKLWFDVGIKRYTTRIFIYETSKSCGLM